MPLPSRVPAQSQSGSHLPDIGIIAIVDDDEALCSALALWFGMKGLRVTRFGSAEQLLQHLSYLNGRTYLSLGHQRTLDVPLAGAILDLNLPGIHGMALATTLRGQDAALPMVMITALPAMDRVRYGSPPPGIRCLKKPFEMDELTELLFSAQH